jgi:hypothetical protein
VISPEELAKIREARLKVEARAKAQAKKEAKRKAGVKNTTLAPLNRQNKRR